MAEKAKWETHSEYYSSLEVGAIGPYGLPLRVWRRESSGQWECNVLGMFQPERFATIDEAKRFAEAKLRELLTEALERLP